MKRYIALKESYKEIPYNTLLLEKNEGYNVLEYLKKYVPNKKFKLKKSKKFYGVRLVEPDYFVYAKNNKNVNATQDFYIVEVSQEIIDLPLDYSKDSDLINWIEEETGLYVYNDNLDGGVLNYIRIIAPAILNNPSTNRQRPDYRIIETPEGNFNVGFWHDGTPNSAEKI